MRTALTIVALAAVPGWATAQGTPVPPAYANAAQAHDVPPSMLYALSLTESAVTLSYGRRPWPWTLNVHGRGHRYASRRAACQALHSALRDTRVVDVGLGQLNVRWQAQLFGPGQRFADPCDALDPYANLDAAAGVLAHCHHQHPASWITAAGCYHRPAGGAPAARYRTAFRAQLATIDTDVRRTKLASTSSASDQPRAHVTPASTAVTRSDRRTARLTWIDPTPNAAHHDLD